MMIHMAQIGGHRAWHLHVNVAQRRGDGQGSPLTPTNFTKQCCFVSTHIACNVEVWGFALRIA